MLHPDEANEAYTAAHAIAGFQLADIAFGVLRMGFYRKNSEMSSQIIPLKDRTDLQESSRFPALETVRV
jgi:hypothetical protein